MILLVALAGCSSQTGPSLKKEEAEASAECVFPGTNREAPGWICDAPVDGLALAAPGNAPATGAGYSFQKDIAAADARSQIASRIRVRVTGMVKRYAEAVGKGDIPAVDLVNTSVSKQITNEYLQGTRVVRSIQGPDKSLWVLVGVDPKTLAEVERSVLGRSQEGDAPEWQRLRGEKTQQELADEILRMENKHE